jgi:uncharacterized membrane protein
VNPFNIKDALLAKHAQHVVLIHFPIALFLVGVAFDFVGHWTKRSATAAAAYYNLAVAAIFSLPVIATGLLAWQWQLGGGRLKGILLQHLVLGVISGGLICVIWYVHFRARQAPGQVLPVYRLSLEAVAVGVVMLTAHLGGFLSGVNIPG